MNTAAIILATCAWASPGHNPYQGEPAAAVDRYTDIPVTTRDKLKARMRDRRFDDFAAITRDAIKGDYEYERLRDMHFGKRTVCTQPDRSMWSDSMVERGLVYCEDGHCIIVPTVCRNVSRVTRVKPLTLPAPSPAPGPAIVNLDELPPHVIPPLTMTTTPAVINQLAEQPQQRWDFVPPHAYWHTTYWHHSPVPAIPNPPVPTIPEPSTLWMAAVGLAFLLCSNGLAARRRKAQQTTESTPCTPSTNAAS